MSIVSRYEERSDLCNLMSTLNIVSADGSSTMQGNQQQGHSLTTSHSNGTMHASAHETAETSNWKLADIKDAINEIVFIVSAAQTSDFVSLLLIFVNGFLREVECLLGNYSTVLFTQISGFSYR